MVEKRRFDEEGDDGFGGSKRSRHALFESAGTENRMIREGLLNLNDLEPSMRRWVREEVEGVIRSFFQSSLRPSVNNLAGTSGVRRFQLRFVSNLPSTIYTGSSIEAQNEGPVQIELVDASSQEIVKSGPLSSIKIDVLVLNGDFCFEDQEDWTEEEFSASIIREREGKRPLVTGVRTVALKEGVGYISDIIFTDNSSWTRSRKFRLGARVVQNFSGDDKIREARSEPFMVKDHRGELNKKHFPPSLTDEIWRLKKIGKDGAFQVRLASAGINTVRDFLRLYVIDQLKLRRILDRVSQKIWDTIIDHARTCVIDDGTLYAYNGAGQSVGLLFNSIYEVVGATVDGQNYCSLDTLNPSLKNLVEVVKRQAYENVNDLVPFNDPSTDSIPRPLASIQAEPCSVPELSLQQFDFPITHQDQPETLLGFTHSSYSTSHIHPVETCNQLEVSLEQNGHPIPRTSSSMGDFFPGLCDVGNSWQPPLVPNSYVAFDDKSQVQMPTYVPATWGQGNSLFFGSGNEEGEVGIFPSFLNSGVHIFRTRKPKVAWCKIRAAVKWGISVRRDAAKRRAAMQLFYY